MTERSRGRRRGDRTSATSERGLKRSLSDDVSVKRCVKTKMLKVGDEDVPRAPQERQTAHRLDRRAEALAAGILRSHRQRQLVPGVKEVVRVRAVVSE